MNVGIRDEANMIAPQYSYSSTHAQKYQNNNLFEPEVFI